MMKPCWRPLDEGDGSWREESGNHQGGDQNGRFDGLLWSNDWGRHVNGDFSMAMIQANNLLEDQCQLESGPLSSLHLGPYGTFVGVYYGHGGPETSRFVNESLFANLKSFKIHWRRLKSSEFNREPLLAKFRVSESFSKPILSPEPSILVHNLNPSDQFLIFASDGLWEHLSNQEAVDIVNNYPRNGIATRLGEAVVRVAAEKREMRYSHLKKIDRGVRRLFHDDITVVVVFIDRLEEVVMFPGLING